MTIADLIERVGAATEDSVDLFLRVATTVLPEAYPGGWVLDVELADWRFLRFEKFLGAKAWESAALALCERVLPGWTHTLSWWPPTDVEQGHCRCTLGGPGYITDESTSDTFEVTFEGDKPQHALALILAMLKAVDARQGDSADNAPEHPENAERAVR